MIAFFALQAAFVAAVLLWLASVRAPSKAWAGALIAVAVFALVGAGLVGIWLYPPAWVAALACGVGLVALAWRTWRQAAKHAAQTPIGRTLRYGGLVLWALVGGALSWHGIAGRMAPAAVFDLAAPLQGEGYCAISGGASPLLNFHTETLAPGKEAYRGQSYGVDFIAISPLGLRTRGGYALQPAPTRADAYRIFGAEVRAPCGGEVMAVHDGMADQRAGLIDPSVMAGNHVVLRCDGHEVLLAHLRQGSVSVAAGQRIDGGDRLGEVGNTGATDEPHLHVSVQRATDGPEAFGGEPVHVTFNGRFLARGACL